MAAVMVVVAGKQPTELVTLKQGTIRGLREKAIDGRVYYSFKTIPYARPPIGPLRFKVRGVAGSLLPWKKNRAKAGNCSMFPANLDKG